LAQVCLMVAKKNQWVAPAPIDLVDPERAWRCQQLGSKIKTLEVDLRARQKRDAEAPAWKPLDAVHKAHAKERDLRGVGGSGPGGVLAQTANAWLSSGQREEKKMDPTSAERLQQEMGATMREIARLNKTASAGEIGKAFTVPHAVPNTDLFTSESRRNYFWKRPTQRQMIMTSRYGNLRDEKWKYREQVIHQRFCLRARAFM